MSSIISHTTKSLPRGRFAKIAAAVLGDSYHLSLTFVGATRARTLNQTTRGKDYVPNVLSFPLSPDAGEIYICAEAAQKEAADFELSLTGYLEYLCIHGCVHLLGHDHGTAMDKLEATYRKKFLIK